MVFLRLRKWLELRFGGFREEGWKGWKVIRGFRCYLDVGTMIWRGKFLEVEERVGGLGWLGIISFCIFLSIGGI